MATRTPAAQLFVRNTLARLVTLGGVALPPLAVTAVPNDEDGVNKRDVEDFEGLEIVSQSKADTEAVSTIETRDVLHPDNSQASSLPDPASVPNAATGWQTPGGLTGDAAATSAANAPNAAKAATTDTKAASAAKK